MGFRFRQTVRLLPGIRLNLSRSGISTSFGGRGATLNLSPKGIRTTIGLPGSGMSYSTLHPFPVDGPTVNAVAKSLVKFGCAALAVIGGGLVALSQCSQKTAPQRQAAETTAQTPLAQVTPPTTKTMYVIPNLLNCRQSANETANIVKTLRTGSAVIVSRNWADWTEIDGPKTCWVKSIYITESARPRR